MTKQEPTHIQFLNHVKNGGNAFLTGGGGVGKTFLINLMRKHIRKSFAMTASTGLAATHIGGMTIHNFSGIGIFNEITDLKKIISKENIGEIVSCILFHDAVVIDEISMIHPKQFSLIDTMFRYATGEKDLPFGGKQIICVGDLLQLPPVDRENKVPPLVFESLSWTEGKFKTFHLTEVKRQDDKTFVDVLNKLRYGITTPEVNDLLYSRVKNPKETAIKLMARNKDVDQQNESILNELEGEEIKFVGGIDYHYSLELTGNQKFDDEIIKQRNKLYYKLMKSINILQTITLKKGCRVLICKNNNEDGYVNGSMGVFIDCGLYLDSTKRKYQDVEYIFQRVGIQYEYDDKYQHTIKITTMSNEQRTEAEKFIKGFMPSSKLKIKLDNGNTVYVKRAEYPYKSGEILIEGEIQDDIVLNQFPIRLGYVITIHKSQGMTLDNVEIDLEGSFSDGQAYVALSRAKSLDGMFLKSWSQKFVKTNQKAVEFYKQLESTSGV